MATKNAAAAPPAAPEVSPQAKKLLANLDRPSKKLKSDLWFKIIAVYPEGALCHCYIYRRWPQIDLKLTDPKAPIYIEKHEGPITAEELLRTWGTGEYRLTWVDEGQPRGKTRICETVIEVHDPERPPVILDLGQLMVEAPANRSYVRALQASGELDTEGLPTAGEEGRQEAAARHAEESSSTNVQLKMLDLFSQASKQAISIAVGAKPGNPVDEAVKLTNLMKPDVRMLELVMETQTANQRLLFDVLNKSQGTGGIASNITELEEVISAVEKLAKRGGGGVTSWVSDIPDILTGVAGIMTAFAAIRAGFSAPAPAAARKPPGRATESAAPASPPALPPKTAETAGTEPGPLTHADLTEIAKRALAALNEGFEGDDFAASLCLWRGEAVYSQIVELGEETLNMLLMPVVQPEDQPAVKKFVGEFFAYGQETEDQPGDADTSRPAEASAPGAEAA